MSKKAIIFGAGNIGRGFLAEILQKANYFFTFIDVDSTIVSKLNKEDSYKINYLSTTEHYLVKDSFNALQSLDKKVIQTIKEADLILTAIGVNNLPKLNRIIEEALTGEFRNKKTIIACENAVRGTSQWKKTLSDAIKNNPNIQMIDAVVDRIVPNQLHDGINVKVENYYSIIADVKQIKFDPNISTIEFNEGFDSYVERKLYLVNALHAYIAWLGISEEVEMIHQSLEDPHVVFRAEDLADELVVILNHQYKLDIQSLANYANTSIKRFQNADLNDSCFRVGAGVLRKIGVGSRITKPLTYAIENNLTCASLKNALYLGLTIANPNDPEVVERDKILKEKGFIAGTKQITNLNIDEKFFDIHS